MKTFYYAVSMLLTCAAPAFANVAVSAPANGATVGSPVTYVATATSSTCSGGVAAMGIYVNNQLTYVVNGSSLNTALSLNPGTYNTVVEEWDRCGGATLTPIGITVAGKLGGVSVTSPANNSTVSSPVTYVASATSSTCSGGVAAMGIYVNNQLAYVVNGSSMNTALSLNPGTYNTVVQEWDRCGGATFTSVGITVAGKAAGVAVTSPANNSTVSSPVKYIATASTTSCSKGVASMGIYVNNQLVYTTQGANLNTQVNMSEGPQQTVVEEWDYCGGALYTPVDLTVQLQTPQSRHVVVVTEENQSYSTVVGNTGAWPNLNTLIGNGSLATNYYADSHPSIGNYFMMTTGQLLTTNDNSTTVWNVDNLARRMLASGVSFRIYAEGITQGYVGGNTGLYLLRHNPFAMLSDVADSSTVANQCIWPFTQFATDLANGTLPEFSFIVPNIDDDAHNGTPQQADSWLESKVIIPLSNYTAFEPGGDGILIVEFDEAATSDTAYGGGHVSPVFWGPNVKVGFTQTSTTLYQHESVLRTVVDALGLANPPGAAATAPSMAEFFVQK